MKMVIKEVTFVRWGCLDWLTISHKPGTCTLVSGITRSMYSRCTLQRWELIGIELPRKYCNLSENLKIGLAVLAADLSIYPGESKIDQFNISITSCQISRPNDALTHHYSSSREPLQKQHPTLSTPHTSADKYTQQSEAILCRLPYNIRPAHDK